MTCTADIALLDITRLLPAAGKAGLYAYFASLASEVADRGIGITLVCPGPISTGTADRPRVIYGPDGPIVRDTTGELRLSVLKLLGWGCSALH